MAPGHEALASLLEDARAKGYRFLVYGAAGPRSYPKLADLVKPELRPAGLIPIYTDTLRHRLAVYRIAPEIPPPPQIFVQFEEGIALDGLRVTAARRVGAPAGWNAGFYLRWGPQQPISRSYKVFIHLIDPQGRIVSQDDAVPAVWTYPTSAWKAGETLIDYHALVLADPVSAPLSMIVGLYDEQTGQLVGRLDAARQRIDDKAMVGELTLEGGAARFRPAS